MDKYTLVLFAQTLFGFVGMLVWYRVGVLRGKRSKAIYATLNGGRK